MPGETMFFANTLHTGKNSLGDRLERVGLGGSWPGQSCSKEHGGGQGGLPGGGKANSPGLALPYHLPPGAWGSYLGSLSLRLLVCTRGSVSSMSRALYTSLQMAPFPSATTCLAFLEVSSCPRSRLATCGMPEVPGIDNLWGLA